MLYFPFERYQIDSSLPLNSIESKLIENTETNYPFLGFLYTGFKLFKGELHSDHFKISRIINYRNSFLPMVEGAIVPHESGCRVYLKLRLNYYTLSFWIFWMSCVSMGFIITMFSLISSKFDMHYLIPTFMLIFGYLLCVIPFNLEVNKTKALLEKLFEQ